MKQIISFILLFLCTLSYRALEAQIQHSGHVLPLQYDGSKSIPVADLSVYAESDAAKAGGEKIPSRHKNEEFAYAIKVRYHPLNAGVWDTLENGWKVWRLGIHSKGATSLNLIFTEYKLERGVRIFLFDAAQKYTLGAYTHLNNKSYEMLAVEPIPGDMVFVEMQVPPFAVNPGKLCIGIIGHDYKGNTAEQRMKDGWFGLSGDCNPDVCCYESPLFSLVKNSVVRIVYMGKERCTGTLLTNTRNNARAYLLTAGHCINTEYWANTAVFFFDYESPYCNGPDGRNHKSISGGTLKATSSDLDFSLIELSEDIPFYYHPYFAGWDATGDVTEGCFCIHHPQGDVKKIALDNDQPFTGNFGEGYDANTHWQVGDWEIGTTEKGSSGAALFNSIGKVIGNLSGGDAYCGNSVNDFFQKISHAWNDYPDSVRQLSYWLDPLKNSVKTMNGLDLYEAFWITGDTLSNIQAKESLYLSDTGLAWGYISGHNSSLIETFAERFEIQGTKYLLGVNIGIAKSYANSDTASLKICLWNQMSNPEVPVIQEIIPVVDFVGGTDVFIEFDSAVAVKDTFLIGFNISYEMPMDTFAVYHTKRDCRNRNTAFVVRDEKWMPMDDTAAYGICISLDVKPVVYDTIPERPETEIPYIEDDLMVYPNPAAGETWIAFKKIPEGKVTVKLFDIAGHEVMIKTFSYVSNPQYVAFDIPVKGIYLLQVITGQYIVNQKVLLYK
ncbi:MAG: T9SS type A sorting domain-containing protein [Bacteroidales bacterium]|nr:T9SS type A sorting domain-containing protein [Bacteroidales bacterium]